ncbi:MAG: Hsp20/alpha crystallin family protein [Gammaproteobacteria bacterium]|jgi:HSP20 family protein|nr:Hsp20/alpha crystallin family protein [Gammaproteobacteria bacterium]
MAELIRSPARKLGWGDEPFDDLFQGFFRPMPRWGNGQIFVPAMNVTERDKEYVVQAELPGIKKEDIDITLQNGVLTIRAESKEESEEKEKGRIIRQERRYGKYMRHLRLDNDVDEGKVKAHYEDGMLELVLPKLEAVQPKKIAVDVQ